ncbi:DUF6332 family protein [Streptomyces sp. NBC_01304]|uniref:DUF6332 family protein n=1 Tax=Streptomyces sp. NBC_01304 TaxID=2903818 RepID=UPI002E13A825|nr:DUF6332 family protein [Streptomyces sp. NBC_01304]
MGNRSQAARDAATVEIIFALVSALLAAAAVFGLVVAPALVFDLSGGPRHALLLVATTLAPVVFVVRLVRVLWRWRDAVRSGVYEPGGPHDRPAYHHRPDA